MSINEAKQLAKKKLVSNDKEKAAKKILSIRIKVIITVLSLIAGTFIGVVLVACLGSSSVTSNRFLSAIASFVINESNNNDGMILYEGLQECDLWGDGEIIIPKTQFEKYGAECNGTYRIVIYYKSYETASIPKSEMQKTIIALDGIPILESVDSTELVDDVSGIDVLGDDYEIAGTATAENTEEDESGEEDILDTDEIADISTDIGNAFVDSDMNTAYKEEKYESALEYSVVDLAYEETTEYFIMTNEFNSVLEGGLRIYGYNWEISKVALEKIDKTGKWTFNLNAEEADSSVPTVGSGIEPQSQSMKNFYYLIKDLGEACDATGTNLITPWNIMGTTLRETGSTFINELNTDSFNYMQDLSVWFTNNADTASGVVIGEKNNGYGQYNMGTWNSNKRTFGNSQTSELSEDSSLGIFRPNCWYFRDQMWTNAFYQANEVLNNSYAQGIINSAEFNSLSELDQQFIFGIMCEIAHNRGIGNMQYEVEFIYELMDIATMESSYGMASLYDMCDKAGVIAFDKNSLEKGTISLGNKNDSITDANGYGQFISVFGLDTTNNSNYPRGEYGYIEAICGGMDCYEALSALVAADTPQVAPESGAGNITSGEGNIVSGDSDVLTMASYVCSLWQENNLPYVQGNMTYDTLGTLRPDCSGFTSYVLYNLGLSPTNRAYDSRAFYRNDMGFQVIGSLDEMMPGDIVAWNGHVQIYAGTNSSGTRLWYSWGGDNATITQQPYDCNNDTVTSRVSNGTAKILRAK